MLVYLTRTVHQNTIQNVSLVRQNHHTTTHNSTSRLPMNQRTTDDLPVLLMVSPPAHSTDAKTIEDI